MESDKRTVVLEYIKQEAGFQAAWAGATGAIAVWWMKLLLMPKADAADPAHPVMAVACIVALIAASFMFVLERSRLVRLYGEYSIRIVEGVPDPDEWFTDLVRDVTDAKTVRTWCCYYLARLLVVVAGGLVLYMLIDGVI